MQFGTSTSYASRPAAGGPRSPALARRLAAAAFVLVTAAAGAVPALADTDCPPGSLAPDCTTPPVTAPTLTASFHGVPSKHDGTGLFSFELRFSEDFPGRLRYRMLRDEAFRVTGGTVRVAKRVARGQNRRWTISVRPDSSRDVTVTLPAGSVVTEAGRSLANPVSFTVPGPSAAALSDPAPRRTAATSTRTPDESPAPVIEDTVAPPDPPKTETAALTATGTSAPSGLPGGGGTTVNMNTMGVWGGAPQYRPGGTHTNLGIDLEVRKRNGPNSSIYLLTPCSDGYTVPGRAGKFCTGTTISAATGSPIPLRIIDRWYSYPADTASGKMRVHVRVKKANDENFEIPNVTDLASWVNQGYGYDEFFAVEAHLEAPGTGVQPTGSGSATWTGRVVAAYNPHGRPFFTRGDLIGGDAGVTVNFGSSTTANVSLTNLKAATRVNHRCDPQCPVTYSSQTWSGLTVSGGSFSDTNGGRSISGTFRDQDSGDSKQADTVGGVFAVDGVMKGGFVATRQ